MTDIPAHRAGFAARSGDTHVIGKDGKAVNVDQAERERTAAEAARTTAAAKKPAPATPATDA